MSPGSFCAIAATVSEPPADAASGLIVSEAVSHWAIENVPKFPRAMYFMNGRRSPAKRSRRRPTGTVAPVLFDQKASALGMPVWMLSVVSLASAAPVVAFTRNSSTSVTACPHGSSHCSDTSRKAPLGTLTTVWVVSSPDRKLKL